VFIGPLPSTEHGADHIENIFSVVRMCVLEREREREREKERKKFGR
jgi:hypothetical protein